MKNKNFELESKCKELNTASFYLRQIETYKTKLDEAKIVNESAKSEIEELESKIEDWICSLSHKRG